MLALWIATTILSAGGPGPVAPVVPAAAATAPIPPRPQLGPYCDTNHLNVALADCTEIIVRHTATPDVLGNAYFVRGAAWLAMQNFGRARPDLDTAIALQADKADYYEARGYARSMTDDPAGAVKDFDLVMKLRPGTVFDYMSRGVAWAHVGDNDRAIADYNEALKLKPNDPTVLANRGVARRSKGEFELALADDDAAIAAAPQSPGGYSARCMTRTVMGKDLENAVADCDQALRINANNFFDYATRGMARYKMGQFDVAIADAMTSLKLAPNNSTALLVRGLAHRAAGLTIEGDADIAAARQQDRHFDDLVKRWRVQVN